MLALVAAPVAWADPCAPTALVSGEPQVVTAVEQTLAARGVATRAVGDCPFVRAEVALLGTEVLTSIVDAHGRQSQRVLETVTVAATLIESWTRFDLGGELLGPPSVSHASQDPAPAGSILVAEDEAVVSESKPVSPLPGGGWSAWLGVAGETSAGSDRSTLFGARAGACGRVGVACIGGMVRFGYDPGLSGNSAQFETERLALDGLALFDFPMEWSRVSLVPGLGIGGGWSRSSRFIEDLDDQEGEEEGENEDRNEVDGYVVEDEGGLRVDVHVVLAIAVTADLSLDVGLTVGLSAFGKYGSYKFDDDPMAGEPRGSLRGGVGMSYRF